MSAPDFDAIIAEAADDVRVRCMAYCYGGSFNMPEAVALQLAAKVPKLCQACGGSGYVVESHILGENVNPCPDCPTIAKLLAIGAAVMTDGFELPAPRGYAHQLSQAGFAYGVEMAVAHLRAVQP